MTNNGTIFCILALHFSLPLTAIPTTANSAVLTPMIYVLLHFGFGSTTHIVTETTTTRTTQVQHHRATLLHFALPDYDPTSIESLSPSKATVIILDGKSLQGYSPSLKKLLSSSTTPQTAWYFLLCFFCVCVHKRKSLYTLGSPVRLAPIRSVKREASHATALTRFACTTATIHLPNGTSLLLRLRQ